MFRYVMKECAFKATCVRQFPVSNVSTQIQKFGLLKLAVTVLFASCKRSMKSVASQNTAKETLRLISTP